MTHVETTGALEGRMEPLLAHLTLPPEALDACLDQHYNNPLVVNYVASCPKTPEGRVRQLLTHPIDSVRTRAVSRLTDPDEIDNISKTRGVSESKGAARNENAHSHTLARLSEHPSTNVIRDTWRNKKTPLDAVLASAHKHTVTSLTGTSKDTTRAILAGPALLAHPELIDEWVTSSDTATRRMIARMPELSEKQLETLLDRRGVAGKFALATHPLLKTAPTLNSGEVKEVLRKYDTWGKPVKDGKIDPDIPAWRLATYGSPTLDAHITRNKLWDKEAGWSLRTETRTYLEPDCVASMIDGVSVDDAIHLLVGMSATRRQGATQLSDRCALLDYYTNLWQKANSHYRPAWKIIPRVREIPTIKELDEVVDALGSNRSAWMMLWALLETFDGTYLQAAMSALDASV